MTVQANARRPRLAIVVSHPIQYYAPLYRRLTERGIVDPFVFYLSDAGAKEHVDGNFARSIAWDVPLLDGYNHTVMQPGSAITSRGIWGKHDSQIVPALERFLPDWVLLYGYASRMNWVSLQWARERGVKVAYMSDSNIHDPKRPFIQHAKRFLVSYFFGKVDAFLSTSEANSAYLIEFGARLDQIYRLPFAIEFDRFCEVLPATVDRPYDFIWAGKFISIKRPQDFLAALPHVAEQIGRPVKVCIVGDGPLRAVLEGQAAQLPPQCIVEFAGFLNQAAMPGALQKAHALVFSSEREPYGLIATEAAAAGLALILTDRIGCVGDSVLARVGGNALTYRAGDVSGLATAMVSLVLDTKLRESMQRESVAIARTHDTAYAARVIEDVVKGSTHDV